MTDIIERLRIESRREPHEPIWRDAIDEIEALRELEEREQRDEALLRQALEALEALQAENKHLRDEVGRLRTDGASAVRWAPGSAYWSEVLVELFGPDARKVIDVLETRWRKELERAERLAEALELMVTTHDEGGWPTATIAIARAALTAYRKQGGEQ